MVLYSLKKMEEGFQITFENLVIVSNLQWLSTRFNQISGSQKWVSWKRFYAVWTLSPAAAAAPAAATQQLPPATEDNDGIESPGHKNNLSSKIMTFEEAGCGGTGYNDCKFEASLG